ncbi:MAG: hypothetical protein NTW16_02910, partial [Bacteroidetes bacterium]|nr:hypothetical protein [Bacteroidota bacterium]
MVILLCSGLKCIPQTPFDFSESAVLARLSRDVHILASDSFAGRESGFEGEHKAYDYISRSFREAGLTPHGSNDTSFLQPFPLVTIRIPRNSNTMVMEGWETPLLAQYDFSPSAYSSNGQVAGNKYILIDLARFSKPMQMKQGEAGTSLRQLIRQAFQEGNSAV